MPAAARRGIATIRASSEAPFIEGENVTLTCTSAGKLPTTQHTWMRKPAPRPPGKHSTWLPVRRNDSVVVVTMTTDDVRADDGLSLVSRIKLAPISAADDGGVYCCLATDGDVTQASAVYRLRVHCKC